MNTTGTPRIYVACLASHNNGKLHGAWIDCESTDKDSILEEIGAMLAESPEEGAEEWAIFDHEGFGGYVVDLHEDLDDLVKLADLIEEHGDVARAALIEEVHIEQVESLINVYQGEYGSLSDWAYEYLQSTGVFGDHDSIFVQYFNFEQYGQDCETSGDIRTIEYGGSLHVFSNV